MMQSNHELSKTQIHLIWLGISLFLTFFAMLSVFNLENSLIGMMFIIGIWIFFRRYQLTKEFSKFELIFTIILSFALVILSLFDFITIGFGIIAFFVFIYYIGLYFITFNISDL